MLRDIETVAMDAGLHLVSEGERWFCGESHPHMIEFACALERYEDDGEEPVRVGAVDGYRISHDWTVEDDLTLWDEADAISADAVAYVDALIRELRACEQVFDGPPTVAMAQRITLVRHVEAAGGVDAAALTQAAVATLALRDAPVIMLVDPWPMPAERSTAAGKLEGRAHVARLLEIGFVRMVGSRYLWAWNRELAELTMADYDYDELLAAKRKGRLDGVLKASLVEGVYGDLPEELRHEMGLPDPEELMDE